MQQPFDESGAGPPLQPEQRGGFNPRTALLAFAFCTFVLGGFSFGWLFMTNWKLLATFQAAQIRLPNGPGISIPNPPGVQPPVPRSPGGGVVVPPIPGAAPAVAQPEPTPDLKEQLEDLPQWKNTRRLNIL